MATLPAAPDACTFDSLGLFTHGQFRCYQNANPCLNLFTHGEFPRAGVVAVIGGPGGSEAGVGNAGRKRQQVEVIRVCDIDEAIAISLLMDDDDDWW
jgi:hypothetical protein